MAGIRTRKRGKTWSYSFEAGKTETGKRKVIEKEEGVRRVKLGNV